MDERYRVLKNSSEVSELKGLAFEEYLTQLFHDLGYKTTKTAASGDFGADVLLSDGDRQIVVQAKQYSSSVGFEAVKEAYFALGYYAADEAWVVTTSTFTQQAIHAANKAGVKLISGSELDVLIAKARNNDGHSSCHDRASKKAEPRTTEPAGAEASARRAAGCSMGSGTFVLCGKRTEAPCCVLKSYAGKSSIVETPMNVDAIGEGAFSNCGLRKIVIHEGVKYIGDGAFSSCKNLETVQLPTSLVFIGEGAFSDCDRLEAIQLPEGLISIGARAFHSCSMLKEVVLAGNLRSIGERAFESSGITALSLPGSLEAIGAHAFARSALVTAELDSGINEISEGAFCSCAQLSQVVLPRSVKRIGATAFSRTAITSIDFPSGLEDICHDAFSLCRSLRRVSLPSGIKNVCLSAFRGCDNLESPDLDDAFYASMVVQDFEIPWHMMAEKPDPETEMFVSERDKLFYIDYDFAIGDFAISANEDGLASYALCDDEEFGTAYKSPIAITLTDSIKVTIRKGAYLYLSHATARRFEGAPEYMVDVSNSYEEAMHMYEAGRFEECKDSALHALSVIKDNDEAYDKYEKMRTNRLLRNNSMTLELPEVQLASDFGAKSGFSILLLSKLQVLYDCMTCRTYETYYDPDISLLKNVKRILNSQITKSPANVQAEFCEFAFPLVYENSMFAYARQEEKIRKYYSGGEKQEAEWKKKWLDESKENFRELLSLIVQRTIDLSKSPDFDVRFLSFVNRILDSQEREFLDEEFATALDEYLVTVLRANWEDEFEKRLWQFTSEHSKQIDMLDERRREVRSSHTGLSFFSPEKMKQRKAALDEIDEKKAVLQNEQNHAESIVAGMLWKSLEQQRLESSK